MKYLKIMITALIMLGILTVPASANSALMQWYGSDNTEVYMLSEDCPLQVSHEKLVFNINQLPERGYADAEAFNSLDSSVTASYTFHNPADYDVTATLYFPFGNLPHYAPDIPFLSAEKHLITVDGKSAEKQLRCYYQRGDFDIATALKQLNNEKISDPDFSEDMIITRYDYQIENAEGIYCELTMAKDRIALARELNGYRDYDDKLGFGFFYNRNNTEEDNHFTLYLFGEDYYIDDCRFYESGACRESEEVENRLILTGKQTLKLSDLITEYFTLEGLSEVDRYNCFVSWLRQSVNDYRVIDLSGANYLIKSGLICGYVYQLTVPAGQDVVNEVTAPLYPGIDGYYEPPYYNFTYLSSPAKTWASFGDLDIEIRSPHYVSQFNAGDLKKDDDGIYRAHLNALPQQEITFRACEVEQPQHIKNSSYNMIAWIIIAIMALGVIGIAAVLIMIIKAFRRHRR